MPEDLIERIYEAAFQPECWQSVLQEAGELVRSPAGWVFLFDEMRPIEHQSTPMAALAMHHGIEIWPEAHASPTSRRSPSSASLS